MSIIIARDDPAVQPLAIRIDIWLSGLVAPYFTKHPANRNKDSKTIHDNVWGMIRLERNELYLLDSPLLQRLRYIRQLGVAHFLFPTTGYSRFEHSLGALQKVDDIVVALKRNPHHTVPPQLDNQDYARAVRLAALLHDVGHCPFSHVSEKFYEESDDVISAVSCLSKYFGCTISASEMLSILMISSPAGRELLQRSESTYQGELAGDGLVEFLVACIAGSKRRTEPDSYFAQIINGTIDCDKLDYIGRDAQMAGTPVMLDSSRLLSKLRVAIVRDRYELAIAISGARALEELIASRVFLYDKLYYHQKVLAAESLLHRALEELELASIPVRDPAFLLRFTDESLLDLNSEHIASEMPEGEAEADQVRIPAGGAPTHDQIKERVDTARGFLMRLKSRDLPHRVMAFAPRFLDAAPSAITILHGSSPGDSSASDGYRHHADVTTFLQELEENPCLRTALANSIADEGRALGAESDIYVSWPSAQRVTGSVAIHAIDADGAATGFDFLFSVDKWSEAYVTNKATGFVFADADKLPELFLASEIAFARHKVEMNSHAWSLAKVKRREVDALREHLPLDLIRFRFAPTFLNDKETKERVDHVAEKFKQVLQQHNLPTPQIVRAWLWQFPDPDLQDSALRLADQMLILNAGTREGQTRRFLGQLLDERGSPGFWALPINESAQSFQSAHVLGYFLKDQEVKLNKPEILPRLGAEDLSNAPFLVLVDDWLCSGAQVSSLLYSWFNMPEKALSQNDVDRPLGENILAVLRDKEILFYFHAAFERGILQLENTIQELGLSATVRYGLRADDEYTLNNPAIFASDASHERIRQYLADTGRKLLSRRAQSNPDKWTEQRIDDFALGYGGIGALICHEFSVPKATVTAMWDTSSDGRFRWLPLVPRDRTRLKSLLAPLILE